VKAGLVNKAEEWQFGALWHFRTGKRGVLDDLAAWRGL